MQSDSVWQWKAGIRPHQQHSLVAGIIAVMGEEEHMH